MIKNFIQLGFFILTASLVVLSGSGCDLTDDDARGSIKGRVTAVADNTPISGALIELFGLDVTTSSDVDGYYEINNVPEGIFTIRISATGFIEITRSRIQVFVNETTHQNFQLIREGEVGSLYGMVNDATTGDAVEGASVALLDYEITTTTNENGEYILQLVPSGFQTVTISKAGYFTTSNDYVYIEAGDVTVMHFTISPELGASGIMRIVLTWGEQPSDLDLHLKTTVETEIHHVFFNDRGDSTQAPYMWLDVDDISSFGPETITIYQIFGDVYQCFIHNYSQSGNEEATSLENSEAIVQIYDRAGLRQTFRVPDGDGLFWYVCNINLEANQIIEKNVIQAEVP